MMAAGQAGMTMEAVHRALTSLAGVVCYGRHHAADRFPAAYDAVT